MSENAKFFLGQLVRHRLFDYRGVVFDADPAFGGTDEWYQKVARSKPPKNEPWYHVLPDGESHTTYVAERNLQADERQDAIRHPLVAELFGELRGGYYESRGESN